MNAFSKFVAGFQVGGFFEMVCATVTATTVTAAGKAFFGERKRKQLDLKSRFERNFESAKMSDLIHDLYHAIYEEGYCWWSVRAALKKCFRDRNMGKPDIKQYLDAFRYQVKRTRAHRLRLAQGGKCEGK